MANQLTLRLTDTNFDHEVSESSIPVLVDFWAQWCQLCRVLGPTIDVLADEYANYVKIGKVDLDTNKTLAQQYAIGSIPTVLLFFDGKATERFVGIQSRDELANVLDQVISPAAA